jgi:hypothetical protein
MLKRYAILAAFALIAVLATPAGAQTPSSWTQVGMLTCKLNPSIGFIIAGHQSMECSFAQNAQYPLQAYLGRSQHGRPRRWHHCGGRARLGRLGTDRRCTRRRFGRRIRWRQRRRQLRRRCRSQRPGWWLRAQLRTAAGLAGGFGWRQCRHRRLSAQTAGRPLRLRRWIPHRELHVFIESTQPTASFLSGAAAPKSKHARPRLNQTERRTS